VATEARGHKGDPLRGPRDTAVGSDASPSTGETMTRWLVVVLAVVLVAGGLFGYDQGVISGALPGIKAAFSLSVFMVQVVTSWVTLGALAGSLVAGALSDGLGRKRTMLLAGALFTLGAAVQGRRRMRLSSSSGDLS
jgi:SP family galactose:H+ symporter-like MFS transporter